MNYCLLSYCCHLYYHPIKIIITSSTFSYSLSLSSASLSLSPFLPRSLPLSALHSILLSLAPSLFSLSHSYSPSLSLSPFLLPVSPSLSLSPFLLPISPSLSLSPFLLPVSPSLSLSPFLLPVSPSLSPTRTVHGQTLCLLSQASTRVRHAGYKGQCPSGHSSPHRELRVVPRPTRERGAHLHTEELPQCH